MKIPILSLKEVNVPNQDKAVLFIDKADNKMKALSEKNLIVFDGELINEDQETDTPTPELPIEPETPTQNIALTVSGTNKNATSNIDINGDYIDTGKLADGYPVYIKATLNDDERIESIIYRSGDGEWHIGTPFWGTYNLTKSMLLNKEDNELSRELYSNFMSLYKSWELTNGWYCYEGHDPVPTVSLYVEKEFYVTISGIDGIYSDVDWSKANGNYYKTELEGDVGIAVKDGKVYKNDNGFYLYLDWEMWGTWTIVPDCFKNPGASGQGVFYVEATDEPFNPDGSSLNGTWTNCGSGPSGKINIIKYKA